ncbi:hypothetical protein PINS_up007770 [Pythium insidiosum]|nr:hypothetical protein PINS_up007770 [Pythium insidiosum]
MEFSGDVLDRFWHSVPQTCCNRCHEDKHCVAYTEISDYWGRGNSSCALWRHVDANDGAPIRNAFATSSFIDRQAPCATPSHGLCGSYSSGMTCCPAGEYCQSFGGAYYQCQRVAPQCSRPQLGNAFSYTNIYVGLGLNTESCCEACAMTPACDAYTYDYDGTVSECTLKVASGYVRVDPSRVWASVLDPLPPCATPRGGRCGDAIAGASCCVGDSYCQPRNATVFECDARPTKCSRMFTGTSLGGDAIATIRTTNATTCCEQCAKQPPCRAFTLDGDTCRLFGSSDHKSSHPTAVSGLLNPLFT